MKDYDEKDSFVNTNQNSQIIAPFKQGVTLNGSHTKGARTDPSLNNFIVPTSI